MARKERATVSTYKWILLCPLIFNVCTEHNEGERKKRNDERSPKEDREPRRESERASEKETEREKEILFGE